MKINKEGYIIITVTGLACLAIWFLVYFFITEFSEYIWFMARASSCKDSRPGACLLALRWSCSSYGGRYRRRVSQTRDASGLNLYVYYQRAYELVARGW